MNDAFIISARRTPVAPRNGAFARIEIGDLATPVVRAVIAGAGLAADDVDEVIVGNALYAGGNPARVIALAGGVPEAVPALTIDTQCCSGLDAILLAASRIRAGEANVIIAGGVESYSRSPLRYRRPSHDGEGPVAYDRPPFSPWADRDPDLIQAAAALARERGVMRRDQERFAIGSHASGALCDFGTEIVPIAGLSRDAFTRRLTPQLCARLPTLAGDESHGLTASTIAVEADAAALVVLVSGEMLDRLQRPYASRLLAGRRIGADPAQPAIGAQVAARALLEKLTDKPSVVELMEAFAPQAMVAMVDLGVDPATVNRGGGALSRGHPIGASGAILAVRMFHEMERERTGATGLAAIAAAGGLGSAALFARV
ncbi:MAG: thiolase family protein [Beijerinckiaceae bacterium]|nr:thiolase family protein [Beijerinckiaceae bacterium]